MRQQEIRDKLAIYAKNDPSRFAAALEKVEHNRLAFWGPMPPITADDISVVEHISYDVVIRADMPMPPPAPNRKLVSLNDFAKCDLYELLHEIESNQCDI